MRTEYSYCRDCFETDFSSDEPRWIAGKKIRRSADKGVNYACTGGGVLMGALIGGPIGALVGGAIGKYIGIKGEQTNSSTESYEFECPVCHRKWVQDFPKSR